MPKSAKVDRGSDFKLTYSFGDAPSVDADEPSPMSTAIKEQPGLRFELVKASVDVMVIDRIAKPTANQGTK